MYYFVSYKYDYLGRRIQKITNQLGTNQLINYIYSGWQVMAETDEYGNIIKRYIHDPTQLDKPLMLEAGANKYYYIQDGMNNVVGLTDKEGRLAEEYFYTPYGKLISDESKIGNPYLFSGRRYDSESDLYYFRHRYYEPELGRFIQVEPKPPVFLTNLYTYARNNPINLKDPYGLCGGNPGNIEKPDPQTTAINIFRYFRKSYKRFKIYDFSKNSIDLNFALPYIPAYFYLNYEDPFWIAVILLGAIAINLFVVIATPFIKYRTTQEEPEQIGTVPGE